MSEDVSTNRIDINSTERASSNIEQKKLLVKSKGNVKANGIDGFNTISFGTNHEKYETVDPVKGAILREPARNSFIHGLDDMLPSESITDWAYEEGTSRGVTRPVFTSGINQISVESSKIMDHDDNHSKSNDGNSVIVFGYPESMKDIALQYFLNIGSVMKPIDALDFSSDSSRMNSGLVNIQGEGWSKITYVNYSDAVKALRENGHIMGGCIIGCVPYSRETVLQLRHKEPTISRTNELEYDTVKTSTGDIATRDPSLLSLLDNSENSISWTPFSESSDSRVSFEFHKTDFQVARHPMENTRMYMNPINDLISQNHYNKNSKLSTRIINWLFGWNEL